MGVGILVLAVSALGVWARRELRTTAPLVDLRLLAAGDVLRANAAMLTAGVGMYLLFSLLTRYVQTPAEAGYGFGVSGVLAEAALIPFSVLGFIGGRFTHWLATPSPARWTFVIYAGRVILAAILFAMVPGSLIATLTSMAILGFGVGGASAIMPQLVLNGVPQQETSSVLSINQIVRTMGFSIGSALASLVLATATETGNVLSTASGYAIAAFCVLSLLVLSALAIIPGRPRATRIDKIADQHR